MQCAMIGKLALMEEVNITSRLWHGAALLILAAIIVLGLFVTLRPLQLESPASGRARALLRLDNVLGATVERVDQGTAGMLGLSSSEGDLVVTSVASEGPAAKAGIRVGDVIERIDNRPASQAHSVALSASRTPVLIIRSGSHAMLNLDFTDASRG
jgi:membrane-associated protease RseP (regulator of RpoE activity)